MIHECYCDVPRLRGKVVLKGRRPAGATDDYDTDNDASDDDDMTEIQSVWTEKSSVNVSTNNAFTFIVCQLFHGLMDILLSITRKKHRIP